MKKLILALLLLLPVYSFAENSVYSIKSFKGNVDSVERDKINDEYAVSSWNVWTDEDGNINKSEGYSEYVNLGNLKNVRNMLNYDKVNGDKYIVAITSNSVYSVKDGVVTLVHSGFDSTWQFCMTIAKDTVYGFSTSTQPWKWDGTTFSFITPEISTGMQQGSICAYIDNRMFISGVSGTESYVYYSAVGIPEDIDGFINVNAYDGDIVTDVVQIGGHTYVTKKYKTYELVLVSAASWQVRLISNEIGCLYKESVAVYEGMPVWVSHRGVEMFDGNFNLISKPIDKFMKSLNMLSLGTQKVTQDTAADWGEGTGVNIDTTTYSGSVTIDENSYNILSQISGGTTDYTQTSTADIFQGFCFDKDIYANNLKVYLRASVNQANMPTATVQLQNAAKNTTLANTGVFTVNWNVGQTYEVNLDLSGITLTANTTYYILIRTNGLGTPPNYIKIKTAVSQGTYSKGTAEQLNGTSYGFYMYSTVSGYYLTADYQSAILEAPNFGNWNIFTVDETKPAGTNINYYVKTSSATDDFDVRTQTLITNNSSVLNGNGKYIQIISSFSRTDITSVPKLNRFDITYRSASENKPPIGITFNDRYHLYVSTIANNANNCMAAIFDQQGQWQYHSNQNVGSACIHQDKLYTGDSTDTGSIFRMEVPNLYTYNGNNYESYRISNNSNLGVAFQQKNLKTLWANTNNIGDYNLTLGYALDGTGVFTNKTVNMTNSYDGNVISRIPIGMLDLNTGYQFQWKISDNGEPVGWSFKELDLIYELLPLEE